MIQKIKQFFQKIALWWKARSKRSRLFLILGCIVVILIAVKKHNASDGSVVEVVKRDSVVRTVIASGRVVSSTDLSLGFEVGDTVRSVNVSVGDRVKKGSIIATLNSGEERAALTSAKGTLLSAEARYKKILEGSSNEEIALAQVNFENAQKDLEKTRKAQDTLVTNAYRKLLSDDLIAEPTSTIYAANAPTIAGTYTGKEGEYNITLSGGDYINFSGVESGAALFSTISSQPFGSKGLTIIFPTGTTSSQGGSWKVSLPNKAGASYVANLGAYNQAIDTRESAITSAEALVAQRQAELNLKRATARQPDIDSALADVITAQAGVESASARLEKKILRAPADGTITKVSVKPGEIAVPQKEVIVLEDIDNLYLEANIGEGNISAVSLGQSVTVSYDAFPGQKYTASVSSIDPSATENGTTINYKIKALISDGTNIRPGMTANMAIVTAEVPDALTIPGRAIEEDENGKFVLLVTNPESRKKKTVKTSISTGVVGDGDIVEIKSGLSEGQSVLWIPEAAQ